MELYLLRHGRTAGNAAGRYIGRTDEPLSPEGRARAEALGADAGEGRVFVTPLLRTQETAAILFPNAEQVIVPELREMDFGAFEGRTADEMERDADYRNWVDGGCTGTCPGGESAASFAARVCSAFARALAQAAARFQSRAVFVLHGGTIMAVMAAFARPAKPFYEWNTQNCEGYLVTLSGFDARGMPVLTNVRPAKLGGTVL